MYYCVIHKMVSIERLMCCEVEFFGRCVLRKVRPVFFHLIVVPVVFHALLPDRCSREFQIVKVPRTYRQSGLSGRITRQYAPARTATSSLSMPAKSSRCCSMVTLPCFTSSDALVLPRRKRTLMSATRSSRILPFISGSTSLSHVACGYMWR